MDITRISFHTNTFNGITHTIKDDAGKDMDVWFARELQSLLGYARWENFQVAINRAIDSCKTQGFNESDHFREVTKMVRTYLEGRFYFFLGSFGTDIAF